MGQDRRQRLTGDVRDGRTVVSGHWRQGGRIVVVGAGFAGLAAAQRLSRRRRVTVIDRRPSFEYLPHIHELVSGVKTPGALRLPLRRLVERAGHRFLCDAVTALDARRGRVETAGGERCEFDVCIVTTGGVDDFLGVPGAERDAMPFKSVDACAAIGRRLRELAGRREGPRVVIVGGGLEGVECLGEILRRYRRRPGLEVTLVERSERLLPGETPAIDREIRRLCRNLPVRFRTGESVASVAASEVRLASGERLPSELTIWTGGVTPSPRLRQWGLAEAPGQWAPVRPTLESRLVDRILVAGDAADLPQPLAKQGYFAIAMGERAADNAERLLAGRRLREYRPSPRPALVALGDLTTFLVLDHSVLAGPALAAAKEAVFQLNMARFDPPLEVGAFCALQERSWEGLFGLALPALTSPAALLRLGDVRVLTG